MRTRVSAGEVGGTSPLITRQVTGVRGRICSESNLVLRIHESASACNSRASAVVKLHRTYFSEQRCLVSLHVTAAGIYPHVAE